MDLRQTIRARGLKQRWIAQQIGLSEPVLSNILSGLTPMPDDKKRALAKLLHVKLPDVVSGLARKTQP